MRPFFLSERTSIRRYLLVLVAVVVLFVFAAGVVALAQPDGDDVFTGCLNENSGVLRNVAVGLEPAKPCNDAEQPITWDRAGPAFEGRIAELEERVAELEEPFGTLDLFVDCAAGDTVGAALADAQTHPGPVSIGVAGVCEEDVSIDRDNVHIYGDSPGDGFQLSPDGATEVYAGHTVTFDNITLTGGRFTLYLNPGATVVLNNSVVQGGTGFGVWVRAGTLLMSNNLITGHVYGLFQAGGDVLADSVDFTGNSHVGALVRGGTLEADNSTFSNNATWGITINDGGSVRLTGSRVASNGNVGVGVNEGSVLWVSGRSVIEGNGDSGIFARAASTVTVNYAEITSNMSDGITLQDLSIGEGQGETVISDNGGSGINCAGPAAIAPVQNQFDMAAIQFSGNTNGPTNCP